MRVQLSSQCPQWSKVDYRLQIATGKSAVKILSMIKYAQDDGQGHQTVVNLTDFSREYHAQVVGKTIPLEDVIFYCGHVNIHQFSSQPFKIFRFLLCKAVLGRIAYPKDDVAKCESIFIPEENQEEALQYNFFLRTHGQYTPIYEVSFTLSDDKDFKLSEYECSNCENRIPTVYCKTQSLFFCDDCCADHHKTKLMHTHDLQVVDKINTLGQCKNHNQKIQYFCIKCQKYLCYSCTQKGAHHQNHEHPIRPIAYFYEETRENVEMMPRKHKEKVEALLFNLGIKRKEVQENHREVKAALVASHQQLLQDLDFIVDEKLQALTSCEIQLKMLHDKIQWAKAFAKFQDKSLRPIDYFQSELRFEHELSKLKIADFEAIFKIKPDVETDGVVRVGTRETLQRLKKKNIVSNSYFGSNPNDSERRDRDESLTRRVSQQESILSYNQNSVMPRKGHLTLLIENSNFKFFQVASK